MVDSQVPVDLLRWSIALLPMVTLLVLMVLLRWTAPQAGPAGMFVAATAALLVFQTPRETLWWLGLCALGAGEQPPARPEMQVRVGQHPVAEVVLIRPPCAAPLIVVVPLEAQPVLVAKREVPLAAPA